MWQIKFERSGYVLSKHIAGDDRPRCWSWYVGYAQNTVWGKAIVDGVQHGSIRSHLSADAGADPFNQMTSRRHLAMVIDGTTRTVRSYYDGVLAGTSETFPARGSDGWIGDCDPPNGSYVALGHRATGARQLEGEVLLSRVSHAPMVLRQAAPTPM